jgi:5'-nucleotidase
MEGRFLGLPTIAISMVTGEAGASRRRAGWRASWSAAARADSLPANTILNVNVPDLPWEALGGFEATRLGYRHKAEPVVRGTDPRGRPLYWVGFAGAGQDAGPGTDFHAIASGGCP